MSQILIDAVYPQEIRVVKFAKNGKILNFDYESSAKKLLKGNIYLARITRVEPSLQAAFIEYDDNKQGFLPFAEIHPNYYNIPTADKKKLQEMSGNDNKEKSTHKGFSNDDSMQDLDRLKKKLIHSYNIQEVIKKGQIILSQVIKEERGNKGASLSSYITLAGRYSILMPNTVSKTGGVSKKIESVEDKKRLRNLLKSFELAENTNVILRTASYDKKDEEIVRDYQYLVNSWNNIRGLALKAKAPALIYQEADVLKRCLRDVYDNQVTDLIVDGKDAFNKITFLMKIVDPSGVKKIKDHKQKQDIFSSFSINEAIENFYNHIVPLESGGYLVINITEALVSIDVNSGKAIKQRSVEETALTTNLEAGKEVARQLQLRDLSGIIVVDFIDMMLLDNKKKLEKELRDSFVNDKARVQIGRVSNLGLIEISRQRLKPSIIETNMVSCTHCNGLGLVKSFDTLSVDIFREISTIILKKKDRVLRVRAQGVMISYLHNYRLENLLAIEKSEKAKIFLVADDRLLDTQFIIESEKKLSDEDVVQLAYDLPSNERGASYIASDNKKTGSSFVKKIFKK